MKRKIGEIFSCNGKWYQCLEGTGCHRCDFNIDENTCGIENPYCTGRSDKKDVIFKKLEKVGEPFSDYCPSKRVIYFQRYKCYQKPIIEGNIVWHWADDTLIDIEIRQKQEDMKEKYKAEDTPLTRLVGRYVNNLIDYNVFEKAVKELYADKEENKPLLKEFDLEAAKAGKHVCTRDGKKVRIICFDKQEGFPIIALVETKVNDRVSEEIALFNINGRAVSDDIDSKLDLMMSTEKKEGWVNIYHDREGNVYTDENVYNREKDAINFCPHDKCRVATVKVGWEE